MRSFLTFLILVSVTIPLHAQAKPNLYGLGIIRVVCPNGAPRFKGYPTIKSGSRLYEYHESVADAITHHYPGCVKKGIQFRTYIKPGFFKTGLAKSCPSSMKPVRACATLNRGVLSSRLAHECRAQEKEDLFLGCVSNRRS